MGNLFQKGLVLQATGALKRSREELPHVRGQGQKPGGPHARRAVAKRSYPTSEVRGSGWECQAATAQERPRRATQAHVQGVVAARVQEGLEELSHLEGQEGQQ